VSVLHHIGCSGGKDSTALLLWAIYESGLPHESLRVTFCDTGNEDVLTYQHLLLIDERILEPNRLFLEVLEPERNFFELAFWKHRFPARKAQFCTHFLKLYPTQEWVHEAQRQGHEVVVLNGKRTGESAQRDAAMKDLPERAWSPFWACEEWAPLTTWTIEDVLAIHKRHRFPLNPLYGLGAHRVGCFPCVNCGKPEIRIAAKLRPQKIRQIATWEKRFETVYGRPSTFFASNVATSRYRTKVFVDDDGKAHRVAPIEEIVKWAQTERGGNQLRLPYEEPKACWMNYGACE
jgi:3'-phosphoadenosine 5'-phosphosulfate sulfotransferase (PAPS reductase)/FAD synthetase